MSASPSVRPSESPDLERPRTQRYASLEGYRGLAAVLVLVYHVYQYMRSGPLSRYPYEGTLWHASLVSLDACVGWFFLVSAFLLGVPYARAALNGTPPTSGRVFLFRRAVRIVPLYVVSILVVWTLRNRAFPGDWRDLVEHLTFTQVFDDKRIFFTIGPAWSLAVEVQFYLLLVLAAPAVCARCLLVSGRRQRLTVLLVSTGAVAAVSIAWKLIAYYLVGVGESTWWVWFGLPAKLDIFAVGLLLAVAVAARDDATVLTRAFRARVGVTGLLLIALAVSTRSWVPLPPYVYFHTLTAIGFGLIVAASVLAPNRVLAGSHSRSRRPGLAASSGLALGLVTYSLYLWHEPVMLFLAGHGLFPKAGSAHAFPLGVLILLPVASVAAFISYWVIEYPTGMMRRTRERAGSRRDYYNDR